jgi:Domain of unknown function (DUF4936)
MPSHLYTYYKVYKPKELELRAQAQYLIGSMQAHCARALLRKRTGDEQYDTWMEVYEGVHADFITHYQAALASDSCRLLHQLERHEEWFDDVPDSV